MQFPKCVLTGEFTKRENSTMPGLEMNPQEKKKVALKCFGHAGH